MAAPQTARLDASAHGAPLVATKLRPPVVHGTLIERPWLIERLREGRDRQLTLVCAPAGYGKSMLLAQWEAADRESTPFVWLSLDSHDADPVRLWMHMVAGLNVVHERVGERSSAALAAGPGALSGTMLPLLIDELDDAPQLVLVLDDWHTVRNSLCDETLAEFVERSPTFVQLVVSSRSEPSLPTGRFRAHGELTEIRARDLRVSPEQTSELFRASGVDLELNDVRRITERTEGWLAGIYLALLRIRDAADPDAFVAQFTGDSRQVLAYLQQDVLATAAPEIRNFLLRTSVLERLSPQLCDAVLETSGSAAALEEISRLNLFLARLGETSEYRYHQLFAAMLRRELETTDAAAVPRLHARASHWHEEHGDIEQAVEHAIESRDVDRASILVTRVSVSLVSMGRGETVTRWLEGLSWPSAEADQQLGVVRALVAGMSGRGRDEIERWVEVASAGPEKGPLANGISSLRSAVAMVRSMFLTRGIAEAERGARFVLEHEPAESPWRYAGLVPLGQALFLQGRSEEARVPLAEARALPGARRLASTSVGLSYLALIELEAGDVASSERLARDALAIATENGHSSDVAAANPHLALGRALTQGPDLRAAIEHLERAVELTAPLDSPYWHVHALLHLAAARHQLGDREGASAVLSLAQAEMDDLPDTGMLGDLLRATQDGLASRPRREGFRGEDLSEAELKVFRAFASGASLGDVARELYLSTNTVKTHRRTIYRKLGVSTREQLLARAATLDLRERDGTDVHPG